MISSHLDQTGFPPTRAEIASALGFRSVNAAEDHLKALARKGIIALSAGTSRGIRLLAAANAELPPGPAAGQGSGRPPAAGKGPPADRPQPPAAPSCSAPAPAHAAPPARAMPAARPDNAGNSMHEVPLVGRVAAGQPILAENHLESSYRIDAALFEQLPDYLLRIRGDSMRDAGMLDGDLLAVKAAPEAHTGQIVVARIGNEVTVKRFRRNQGSEQISLLPENPAYEPILLQPGSDEFCIEGIAVGLIRQQARRR